MTCYDNILYELGLISVVFCVVKRTSRELPKGMCGCYTKDPARSYLCSAV